MHAYSINVSINGEYSRIMSFSANSLHLIKDDYDGFQISIDGLVINFDDGINDISRDGVMVWTYGEEYNVIL